MKYKHVKKGEYVFKQGEPSQKFYGIISGSISMRSVINLESEQENNKNKIKSRLSIEKFFNTSVNYREYEKENIIEEELCKMKNGNCFGEIGLLCNNARTCSALASEDTDLFVLDRNEFGLSFNKSILKSEIERKNFILRKIPPFSAIHYSTYNNIFKKIIPKFFDRNEIIFRETDIADCFYLLYTGSCKILKNMISLNEINKNINNINNMKSTTVLKVEKGKCLGLEAIFGKNYGCSLKVDSDFAVLLEFKTSKLQENILESLKSYFHENYFNFIKDVKILIDKKLEVKSRTKIVYRDELIRKYINNNKFKPDDEILLQKKIDTAFKYILKKKDISPYNNLKNCKKTFLKTDNNSNHTLDTNYRMCSNNKAKDQDSIYFKTEVDKKETDIKKENIVDKLAIQFLTFPSQSLMINSKQLQEDDDNDEYIKEYHKNMPGANSTLSSKLNNNKARNQTAKLTNSTTTNNDTQTTRDTVGLGQGLGLMFKFEKNRPFTATTTFIPSSECLNLKESSIIHTDYSKYEQNSCRNKPVLTLYCSEKEKNLFFKNDKSGLSRQASGSKYKHKHENFIRGKSEKTLNKDMKNNIINWTKVLNKENNFNSGRFNLPLCSVSIIKSE